MDGDPDLRHAASTGLQEAIMTTGRIDIPPEDVAVTLAVRQDLGPQHEAAVIGEFLDRVGHTIDARVDERVRAAKAASRDGSALPIAAASLALGIPLTAIASNSGIAGLALAWGGIAVVNLAHALRR
jgi:hypothetical protein